MRYLEFDVYRAGLALSVSLFVHLIILAIIRPALPASGPAGSTIEITLAASGHSDFSGGAPPADTATSEPPEQGAWSGERTRHTRIRRRHAGGEADLSWMQDYFSGPPTKSGTRTPPAASTSGPSGQGNQEALIRSLLSSVPTTGSSYWQFLVRHLADSRYFDRRYPLSQLDRSRTVILELKISPNGFMERARVLLSSGDEALDKAAIRSAYAANPYRPPPPEDARNGYLYRVRITYTPDERSPGD